jgi:hypothetical protein
MLFVASLLQFTSLTSLTALAQVPELPLPASASGHATTAQFYAGNTFDGGATFATAFAADQAITILAEIRVEENHVNSVGNIYLVVVLGEQMYIRIESGEFALWDGSLETLVAAFPGKTLQAIEAFSVIEDVPFGAVGLAGATLFIYLAYDSVATAGDLYYSGTPLGLEIAAAGATGTSYQLFSDNVSTPIIQTRCIICHSSTGIASATVSTSQLQYISDTEPDFLQSNYNVLVNYIRNVTDGNELILSKPRGMVHVGGVQLVEGSDELEAFEAFVKAVLSE